ncbi:MAG: hypothetical protein NC548_55095 [Lachnospiraceae bacterium]|nr:hypothetical protein [Lachnospiraceae bacterium]
MVEFAHILIVGNGSLALQIAQSLAGEIAKLSCASFCESPFSLFSAWCKKNAIPYQNFYDKNALKAFLQISHKETLIISANNYYVFPQEIIKQPQIKIINYHNSLLPAHRGLNAQMWSIFEQDSLSGITWHCVNTKIDCGEIIIQKSIVLDSDETYLSLTQKQLALAFEAFSEICPALLHWNLTTSLQKSSDSVLHKKADLPNGGYLNLNWRFEKKFAFLRSMDCGKSAVLPKPKVVINGKEYEILNYHKNLQSEFGFDLTLGETQ